MSKLLTVAALAALTVSAQARPTKEEVAASAPVCREAKECEIMWAAARDWIVANVPLKIQTYTPDFIQTAISTNTSLAATLTKRPMKDGSYKLTIELGCDNWIGCHPVHPLEAAMAFNQAVRDSLK